VTHAKVAQPSDLQQCPLVQVNRYDALLGGKDSYAADRRAVRQLLRAASEALDSARANRAFLQRAVRYLAGEAGIRQIIVTIASTVTVGHGSAGCERECERRICPVRVGARPVHVRVRDYRPSLAGCAARQ
jgi:S-adenosyl methyltransferase